MKEFIEELKNNKRINEEKGLENRVDIDYIISRLENMHALKDFITDEVDYCISEFVADEGVNKEDRDTVENMNDLNYSCIIDRVYNDDWMLDSVKERIHDVIYNELNVMLDELWERQHEERL